MQKENGENPEMGSPSRFRLRGPRSSKVRPETTLSGGASSQIIGFRNARFLARQKAQAKFGKEKQMKRMGVLLAAAILLVSIAVSLQAQDQAGAPSTVPRPAARAF